MTILAGGLAVAAIVVVVVAIAIVAAVWLSRRSRS